MQKDKLSTAYDADTPDALKKLYRDWANTYDDDFAQARDYLLPRRVADAFAAQVEKSDTPVVDVGAGTGLVGGALARNGVRGIDALDPSAEMLDVAGRLGVYDRLIPLDLETATKEYRNSYGGLVSAGTFTHGHLGPDALPLLVALLRPKGLAVISVNAAHYEAAGFSAALDALPLTQLTKERTRIYGRSNGDGHDDDTGWIVSMRKSL